jgi:pimeloyl-ACP methyl ester carboxylesterase
MELVVDKRRAYAYTAAHEREPKKPTVVFVHGAGLDHSQFALQSRYFGYHGRNVLAVDLPAHGRSEGPPRATVQAMAAWLFEFLDAAKVDKASIVGHSMGSLIGVECAAMQPARVERLALIGTAYPMKVGEAFLEAARRDDPAAFDMETIWGHAPQVALGANPNPGMWMYGDALARLRRLAPGVLYNDLNACHTYASGTQSAEKVRCPVLFILGRRDMMTPIKAGLAFAEAFTQAKSVQIAPSGHTLMAEAPDATLDALIDFL